MGEYRTKGISPDIPPKRQKPTYDELEKKYMKHKKVECDTK